MRQFLLLAFIGTFLMTNVTSSKFRKYPSNLAWLFGLNESNEETQTVCQTDECTKIAKIILESMDKSIDPCDDFYEYACGKWAKRDPVQNRSVALSLWNLINKKIERQIQDILDVESKEDELLAVKLAKKLYKVCMDTDAMENQGLEPLLSTLSRIGGWPMIMDSDEWDEQEYDWQKVDNYYARLAGINALHHVVVYVNYSNYAQKDIIINTPHFPPGSFQMWTKNMYNKKYNNKSGSDEKKQSEHKNSTEESGDEDIDDDDDNDDDDDKDDNVIENSDGIENKLNARRNRKMKKTLNNIKPVFASMTTLSPEFVTEEMNDESNEHKTIIQQQYAKYILKVARAIAKEREIKVLNKYINKDIEDMIKFQMKLTDIYMYAIMTNNEELEVTLYDFQKWYDEKKPKTNNGKINWVYKITEFFDEASVIVDGNTNITVALLGYFEELVSLLDETTSRTIVNYIHWNFISSIIKTTTNEMRVMYNRWQEFDKKKETRSSVCIREAGMSDILAYEYVRKHFSGDIAKTAMDMIDDIQKEVEYQVKDSDWMDDSTKDYILAKLVHMKKLIGYPDWYKNNTIVKRHYRGLIVGKSYYENTLSYSKYITWKKLRVLTKNNTSGTWLTNPLTLSAFFIREKNSLAVTAANFQSPFFAYNRPQIVNFGIIGFVMAHEVTHGFGPKGHLYDKHGDYMEWLSTMAQAYSKRIECFVDQFNNYPFDKASGQKLKNYGNQTANENFADTMGLQAVFRAYRRRERKCGKPDVSLPGLEKFTNDQLFFLSFANLWCEAPLNPSVSIEIAKVDTHSTARLRVIGSVSNSEDFAKAYNCPIGSAMNPEKKCNIWK